MLLSCVEKQGKYRESWTLRRIAFDTERSMLYCSDKETEFRVVWKHQMRVVRIIAKPSVVDIKYDAPNFDKRDLFSFKVEGSFRHLDVSVLSHVEQPVERHAVTCPLPPHSPADAKKGKDSGSGEMLAWYMRTDNETDFMKIYTTIREVMIRDGMRPPQFWGLPKMDPRIDVPLAEPPLYLWFRLRAVKHTVFYACVHGRLVLKGADLSTPGSSVALCEEPLYLTLFDNSVMVIRDDRHVVTGIPAVNIKALHYSTMDVEASVKEPKNEKCRCFLSFLSNDLRYHDILFVPTLERFADANAENAPAAQVNRVQTAFTKLAPVTQQTRWAADLPDLPPAEVKKASEVTAGHEEGVESARHGLLDVYARAQNALSPLRLPDPVMLQKTSVTGQHLLGPLPAPHRLRTLASRVGVTMKKALTDYPLRYEYFSSGATVADPTCPRKEPDALEEYFFLIRTY
ncbi:uncharacterized protein Tco025E_09721 [Trypanosoma conorhini]|uniref:Uncharacterized protein n=1 Tax=Trypanosoma conorhini TaxID=83891 RepID=A0A3R7LZB7_9TRYP|nr:uncharacterized protein Tco025E_09721 [Trypanosoma conorhini]RNE96502.1 hypothetical protein Tco025E_09721 [Trypanosoma conorhini]